MNKSCKSVFAVLLALVSYCSFAPAQTVSFDSTASGNNISSVVSGLKSSGLGAPGLQPGPWHLHPGPWHPQPGPQPFPGCHKAVVSIRADGDIYADGIMLGGNAVDYQASCTSEVAWKDSYGDMNKGANCLGQDVKEYKIADYTGDVVWIDGYRNLYKNDSWIGQAVKDCKIASFTGDVVWTDSYGSLYKNGQLLVRDPASYQMDEFGKVVWTDSYGTQYVA